MKTICCIALMLSIISTTQAQVREPVSPAPIAPEWSADMFDADVYPSQRAAARRLAVRWVKEIEALKEPPKSIFIAGERAVAREAIREIGSIVKAQLPHAKLHVEMDPERLSPGVQMMPGELWGVVQVEPEPQTGHAQIVRGTLTISPVEMGARPVSAAFVDKPWADDLAEFVNQRPNERWVVGWPPGPCMSEAEAHSKALQSAAATVVTMVLTRMSEIGRWDNGAHGLARNKVESAVQAGRLTSDRFVQRFDRGFATTWREAVLLDVSKANIDALARECMRSVQRQRETWAQSLVSIAVLFVVIYGLYLLLNAVTKGYFVWRLRMAAVVVLALGVLAVMYLVTYRVGVSVEVPERHTQPPGNVQDYRIEYRHLG